MSKKVRKKKRKMPQYKERGGLGQIITYGFVLIGFLIVGIINKSFFNPKMYLMFGALAIVLIYSTIRYLTKQVDPSAKENYEKFVELVEEDDDFDYDYYANKTEEELYSADDEDIDDVDEENDEEDDIGNDD